MLQVALSQLKTHSRRFIAITLAVLLAVAFLSATLMVNASTAASLKASIGQAYSKGDLVASPSYDKPLTTADATSVASSPVVAQSYAQRTPFVQATVDNATVGATFRNMPDSPLLEAMTLTSGAWPSNDTEVTVDATTAERRKLSVGSTATLTGEPTFSDSGATPGAEQTMTISGITATSSDPITSGLAQFVGTAAAVSTFGSLESGFNTISVILKDGVSMADAKAALATAVNQPVDQILTADEKTTQMVASFTGGQDQLTIVLLAFAGVALLVAALVVSNTFSVLVAQRTRELALLRCIGASRSQIRGSVIVEALIVGFFASVLGVLAATGTMALILTLLSHNPDFAFATLAVPPSAIIAGMIVGTLLTVLASLVPARAATAVAPLAALRPADDASVRQCRWPPAPDYRRGAAAGRWRGTRIWRRFRESADCAACRCRLLRWLPHGRDVVCAQAGLAGRNHRPSGGCAGKNGGRKCRTQSAPHYRDGVGPADRRHARDHDDDRRCHCAERFRFRA
ncbi:ABC transporter permease [Arthrobacter psychrolactophilus]